MSHLTDNDRSQIENGLNRRMSFQQIAQKVDKSHSTISREVLKHRVDSNKGAQGRASNRCVFRRNCDVYYLCPKIRCHRKCSTCNSCNTICPKFKEEVCNKLSAPPYVCNGCPDEHRCTLRKKFYIHNTAQQEYRQLLLESRRGANLTEAERAAVSAVIHAGISKGQSVHHIMSANKDLFTVCEKTVYRYVNAGIIRTQRGDMPKSCMMKPRKRKSLEHKVDSKCRINRTHNDYKKYCEAYPDSPVVEMDSVMGRGLPLPAHRRAGAGRGRGIDGAGPGEARLFRHRHPADPEGFWLAPGHPGGLGQPRLPRRGGRHPNR